MFYDFAIDPFQTKEVEEEDENSDSKCHGHAH